MTTTDEGQGQGGQQAPPAGDKQPEGYDKAPTMGDLRKMVTETVEGALKPFMDKLGGQGSAPSGSASPPAAAGGADAGQPQDLAAMVNAAIAKVLGDRDQQSEADKHRKQHEAIEAAAAERTPVERPRRSRWLGKIWD